jgi:hypothetical protein
VNQGPARCEVARHAEHPDPQVLDERLAKRRAQDAHQLLALGNGDHRQREIDRRPWLADGAPQLVADLPPSEAECEIAGDDATERRSTNDIDRYAGFLERPDHPDVDHSPRSATRKHHRHVLVGQAANDPGEVALVAITHLVNPQWQVARRPPLAAGSCRTAPRVDHDGIEARAHRPRCGAGQCLDEALIQLTGARHVDDDDVIRLSQTAMCPRGQIAVSHVHEKLCIELGPVQPLSESCVLDVGDVSSAHERGVHDVEQTVEELIDVLWRRRRRDREDRERSASRHSTPSGVGSVETGRQETGHPRGRTRIGQQQLLERLAVDGDEPRVAHGTDRGGAFFARQQRHLSDQLAGPDIADRPLGAVRRSHERPESTRRQHEDAVGVGSLFQESCTGRNGDDRGAASHLRKRLCRQVRKHGCGAQPLEMLIELSHVKPPKRDRRQQESVSVRREAMIAAEQ